MAGKVVNVEESEAAQLRLEPTELSGGHPYR